jgi:hypothetical protein
MTIDTYASKRKNVANFENISLTILKRIEHHLVVD